jgi:molecular chaperone GrpE
VAPTKNDWGVGLRERAWVDAGHRLRYLNSEAARIPLIHASSSNLDSMSGGFSLAMNSEETVVSNTAANKEGAVTDTVETTNPAEQVESLTAERDQLAREKAELQDLLQRRQAEFDNYRKRTDRERSEFADFVTMETIGKLLGVLDDFERALKAAQKSDTADKEIIRGFELIYQRLTEILQKMGLEPIDTVEQQFDPHLHHAVERVETEEEEDHKILEEFQRGYRFKGRLLRPAMVKVAIRK